MPTIGENIKARRKAKKLTQAALAGRLGVSQPVIADLERQRHGEPTVATLRRLAAALGCRPADFMAHVE